MVVDWCSAVHDTFGVTAPLSHICNWYEPVLNMIRFPDRDPTGFCTLEPDPDWTGFWKKLNRIRYGYPTCIDHWSKLVDQSFFFLYKPDWIKYFDRSTGLGSDRITQWKFWTGLGFQKSPICSTLVWTTLHILNLCQILFMIALASNPKTIKFETPDPDPETWIKP